MTCLPPRDKSVVHDKRVEKGEVLEKEEGEGDEEDVEAGGPGPPYNVLLSLVRRALLGGIGTEKIRESYYDCRIPGGRTHDAEECRAATG